MDTGNHRNVGACSTLGGKINRPNEKLLNLKKVEEK